MLSSQVRGRVAIRNRSMGPRLRGDDFFKLTNQTSTAHRFFRFAVSVRE